MVRIFCTNNKETPTLELIFMIENLIFKLGCLNIMEHDQTVVRPRKSTPAGW